MKKRLVATLLWLGAASSFAQVPVLYQVQIEPSDAAGAALNAAVQAKFASEKRVQLFSDADRKAPPRLKLLLRALVIDGMPEPASAWEAIWLLEQKDGFTWLNTWMGYTGLPKADEMADMIVNGVYKDIDSVKKTQ